ncbi:hypothetical protein B0H19DRAFT_1084020 [Mycena capillaripes]|nr:hypothetical protein B0H19DRAFT_1084020 [Mycena capillaripes]
MYGSSRIEVYTHTRPLQAWQHTLFPLETRADAQMTPKISQYSDVVKANLHRKDNARVTRDKVSLELRITGKYWKSGKSWGVYFHVPKAWNLGETPTDQLEVTMRMIIVMKFGQGDLGETVGSARSTDQADSHGLIPIRRLVKQRLMTENLVD